LARKIGVIVHRMTAQLPGGPKFCAFVEVGNYIEDHVTVWEREPMERLAAEGQLGVYFIMAFGSRWLRDKNHLKNLEDSGRHRGRFGHSE
jgi:hypothetical protein